MKISPVLQLTGLLCAITAHTWADDVAPPVLRVGAGVTPPKLLYKVEPEYSADGLNAGVQGTVVFEAVISEAGKAIDIVNISPLGFGLDEKAQAAIEKWRFEPSQKGGQPVRVLATIEVNFRLQSQPFDAGAEHRRTRFNLALQSLRQQSGSRRDQDVKTMQELAKQNFPPAMYVVGKLLETGDSMPRDTARAAELIKKAADKNYGPALFEVGLDYYEGRQASRDPEKGMRMIRDAAILGSYAAQLYLGDRYERGADVVVDTERARRYFGLCAAAGHADCQIRLAKLLLGLPKRQEREYVQAIAWLQLAADQNQTEAQDLAAKEAAQLTAEQTTSVKRLKPQLVHKQ